MIAPLIILSVFLLLGALAVLVERWHEHGPLLLCTVLMISLVRSAGISMDVFGLESNWGNVAYAAATFTIGLVALRGRWDWLILGLVAGAMALATIVTCAGMLLPVQAGNEEYRHALTTAFGLLPLVTIGAMVAFVVAQAVNLWLVDRLHRLLHEVAPFWGAPLALFFSALLVQLVDSQLFFPIAFGTLSVPYMGGGYVIKVALAALGSFVFAPWQHHRP